MDVLFLFVGSGTSVVVVLPPEVETAAADKTVLPGTAFPLEGVGAGAVEDIGVTLAAFPGNGSSVFTGTFMVVPDVVLLPPLDVADEGSTVSPIF